MAGRSCAQLLVDYCACKNVTIGRDSSLVLLTVTYVKRKYLATFLLLSFNAKTMPRGYYFMLSNSRICRRNWRFLIRHGQNFFNFCCVTPMRVAWKYVFGKRVRPITILLCGLEGAGKTTILYWLKLGNFIQTVHTNSIIEERFEIIVGYPPKIWYLHIVDASQKAFYKEKSYLTKQNFSKIIFVVDSLDRQKLRDAQEEIGSFLYDEEFLQNGGKILVLANKQDVRNSMTISEIIELLELPENIQSRWHVIASSALVGTGILEGLDWLLYRAATPSPSPSSLTSQLYCDIRQIAEDKKRASQPEYFPLLGYDVDTRYAF